MYRRWSLLQETDSRENRLTMDNPPPNSWEIRIKAEKRVERKMKARKYVGSTFARSFGLEVCSHDNRPPSSYGCQLADGTQFVIKIGLSITTCTDPFAARRLQYLDLGAEEDLAHFHSVYIRQFTGDMEVILTCKNLKNAWEIGNNGIFCFVSKISETGVTPP
jgi:hypothetical protein